jgi:hypothetical protein
VASGPIDELAHGRGLEAAFLGLTGAGRAVG